jgi:hypothetical protein
VHYHFRMEPAHGPHWRIGQLLAYLTGCAGGGRADAACVKTAIKPGTRSDGCSSKGYVTLYRLITPLPNPVAPNLPVNDRKGGGYQQWYVLQGQTVP